MEKWYNVSIICGGKAIMGAKKSISNKIIAVFLAFTVVTLSLIGILVYSIQMSSYKRQCEINVGAVGEYLAELMAQDGIKYEKKEQL